MSFFFRTLAKSVFAASAIASISLSHAQLVINHVNTGQGCGEISVVNTSNDIWDVRIFYTLTGDLFGDKVARRDFTDLKAYPNDPNKSFYVLSAGINCSKPHTVSQVSWTGRNLTSERNAFERNQTNDIQRILEREEQKRRDAENAIRERQEAERQKIAAKLEAQRVWNENNKQWLKERENYEKQEKQRSLDSFDREMDQLAKGTSCGVGRSIQGTEPNRNGMRIAIEQCISNQQRDKAKAATAASEKRQAESDAIARHNEYQQDLVRQDAFNRQQALIKQQQAEAKRRQEAIEEERIRSQRQAAAKVDLDKELAKHSAEIGDRRLQTRDSQRSNSNLADLINNLK